MRDRMIALLKDSSQYIKEQDSLIERIADHLLANGVIVPPCKVGDSLYAIFNNKVVKGRAKSLEIVIEENNISHIVGLQFFKGITMCKGFSFGTNIFLTREKAEQALKEREGR